MAVKNISELEQALVDKNFDAVLGTNESNWIDFKQKPYGAGANMPSKSKFELAKDVASFLNDGGGCLVIGFAEKTDASKGTSAAAILKPVSFKAVNLSAYKDILNGNIYPAPRGLAFDWYDDSETAGVLVIKIPEGKEKPYLVRRFIDEDGKQVEGISIPRRNDDRTIWDSAESLHSKLTRKDNKSTEVNSSTATQTTVDSPTKRTAKSVRHDIIEAQDWSKEPVIILQAVPLSGPPRLKKFYDEIRSTLDMPTPIRQMGFGLRALGGIAEAVDGAFVLNGIRDAAGRLDPNGLFTVALKVSPTFVAWGMHRSGSDGSIRINGNVIVEITYEFCRFVRDQLAANGLAKWQYVVEASNLKSDNVRLAGGKPGLMPLNGNPATSDEWVREAAVGHNANSDAFNILTELYSLFMLSETQIPHTVNSEVAEQSIIDLNTNPY